MRPVNLLPQSARPYVASGKAGGGSYIVIGVLAALVLAVAAYVLTTNKITTKKNDIAQAQQETQAAQAKSAGLQKYGQFNQVASARAAVRRVARGQPHRLRASAARDLARAARRRVDQLARRREHGGSSSSASASATSSPARRLDRRHQPERAPASAAPRRRSRWPPRSCACGPSTARTRSSSTTRARRSRSGRPAPAGGGSGDCGNNFAFDIVVNLTNEVTGFGDQGKKVPAALGGGS